MVKRDFSVLVIAHGRAGHLQNLLAGAERSNELPNEVVLVYMDEPDPEPVSTCLPLRTAHVSSRRGETGLPLARARNTAAALASSQNLVFLDVDCIPSTALFTALVDAIAAEPVLAMAEPRYLRGPLESGQLITDASLQEASVAHHTRKGLALSRTGARHEMFWSLGFSISSQVFRCLGGFDDCYTGYGAEDTDFAFRARAAGVPMCFVPQPLFHQHHGVYKPPLNHFDAIVANARQFHAKWDAWPMEGWLGAFAAQGLLEWDQVYHRLTVLRTPAPEEIENARSSDPY